MSKVLNLTNFGPLNPPEGEKGLYATETNGLPDFLQSIDIGLASDKPKLVSCFKDVGNLDPIIQPPFNAYRLSMLTLPANICYQNYKIDQKWPAPPTLILENPENPLPETVHTLLLYDINAKDNRSFHYCDNDETEEVDPRYACVDAVTSTRGSVYKPFHLFYTKDLVLYADYNTKIPIPPPVYLIPFSISEGVVVYFIIAGTETQQQGTLNAHLKEIINMQSDNAQESHWTINSEIVYHDNHGIFTCTSIKSTNYITIGPNF